VLPLVRDAATDATRRCAKHARQKKKILRFATILPLCGVIISLDGEVLAQTPQTTGNIVALNPVLNQIAQVDPDVVKNLINGLTAIRTNAPREGTARGEALTEGEQRQIAANPEFAAAFEKSPVETLGILRRVNEFLRERREPGATQ
jgi:hypothetical protein